MIDCQCPSIRIIAVPSLAAPRIGLTSSYRRTEHGKTVRKFRPQELLVTMRIRMLDYQT